MTGSGVMPSCSSVVMTTAFADPTPGGWDDSASIGECLLSPEPSQRGEGVFVSDYCSPSRSFSVWHMNIYQHLYSITLISGYRTNNTT
ncbi:hypothetical protein NPIL_483911 [Nephila pilipes]|uniref:Uncharacterized protein n=1 Tax=Nephila pilipes TaxID=299642 RepID=A0A8X6MR44_NEPPI|nr:hypothetical protein NPIL_483911 [Nephila pilipes]